MKEKDPFAVLVGKNIHAHRKATHMTQAALAEKLNLTPAHISRVERGEKMVSLPVLKELVEIFEISYDELLKDSNNAHGKEGIQEIATLLDGHSAEYIMKIEKLIRAAINLPRE